MDTTKYERTYKSVQDAIYHTENLGKVIDFLRNAKEPVTCKEIGLAVFGNIYEVAEERLKRHYAGQLGQMLKHLVCNGYVKMELRDGEPIEIEKEEYVRGCDAYGNPEYIDVFDIYGNKYKMQNPKYNWRGIRGHYEKKKVTFVPKVKYWSLIA